MKYNFSNRKKMFPLLIVDSSIVYFDSAATTLKPYLVIDAIKEGYEKFTIPCEKGQYSIAYSCYEKTVANTINRICDTFFLHDEYHIVFSHSVTILLERLLFLFYKNNILKKNNIRVAIPYTYHSSIYNAVLRCFSSCQFVFYSESTFPVCDIDILYIPYVDHITGYYIDCSICKEYKIFFPDVYIILDLSQGISLWRPHFSLSNIDFIVGSSHKMYGPDGVAWIAICKKNDYKFSWYGILGVRKDFSTGSLSYPSIYAYSFALQFVKDFIYSNKDYYSILRNNFYYIYNILKSDPDVVMVSSSSNNFQIISFSHNIFNAHEIAEILNQQYICVRSGDICAPGITYKNGIVRISMGYYNDDNDIKKLGNSLLLCLDRKSAI